MTSTASSVGMEQPEAGRNEPKNLDAVAIDRLREAIAYHDDLARTVPLSGHVSIPATGLRSLITAYESQAKRLREVEGLAARLVKECEAEFMLDGMWNDTGQLVAWKTVTDLRSATEKTDV